MKTWKCTVRNNYGTLDELKAHNESYGVVKRCGYETAEDLWNANPFIGGSTNPDDFGVCSPIEMLGMSERIAIVMHICEAVDSSPEKKTWPHHLAGVVMAVLDEKSGNDSFVDWTTIEYARSNIPLMAVLEDLFGPADSNPGHVFWGFVRFPGP